MIELAQSDEQIAAAYVVMSQLRPHISREQFVPRVRRQQEQGYLLAVARDGEQVVAAAGFRILVSLAWGKFLYVDDLSTDTANRSRGFGKQLLDWLIDYARREGCDQLHLDSGVHRFDAHRFYLRERMRISSHHFSLEFDQ